MRSTVATDVPPNFMTRRGMSAGAGSRAGELRGCEKARIHDAGGCRCQRGPRPPPRRPPDRALLPPPGVLRAAQSLPAEGGWPEGPGGMEARCWEDRASTPPDLTDARPP